MELHDLLRRKPWQKMIFDVGLDDEPRTYLRGRSTTGRGARELRRQLQAALDARVVKTQASQARSIFSIFGHWRAALLAGVQFRQLELLDAVSVSGWGAGGFFQTIKDHAAVFQQLPGWATAALIESKIRTASHLELRPQPAA